jgi:glycerol-3-phosphate dehydrogenase
MDHGTDDKTISPSQGVHIMIDKKFCPTDSAIMIPKTSDGRVLLQFLGTIKLF